MGMIFVLLALVKKMHLTTMTVLMKLKPHVDRSPTERPVRERCTMHNNDGKVDDDNGDKDDEDDEDDNN